MGREGHGQHREGGSGGMRTQGEPGGGSPAVGRPGAWGPPCRVPCTASAPEHKAQCWGWNVLAALQRGYKHASPEDALAAVYPAWSGGGKPGSPWGGRWGVWGLRAGRVWCRAALCGYRQDGRTGLPGRPLRPPQRGHPAAQGIWEGTGLRDPSRPPVSQNRVTLPLLPISVGSTQAVTELEPRAGGGSRAHSLPWGGRYPENLSPARGTSGTTPYHEEAQLAVHPPPPPRHPPGKQGSTLGARRGCRVT